MNGSRQDRDAEIDRTPPGGGGRKGEPELVRLCEILTSFNDQFGTLFANSDRVFIQINEDVFPSVISDTGYKNAVENTPAKAGIELTAAVKKTMRPMLKDDTEIHKQFVQYDSFKQFVMTFVNQLLTQDLQAG